MKKKLQKKFGIFNPIREKLHKFAENEKVSGILVMKKFITKPMDAVYEVLLQAGVKRLERRTESNFSEREFFAATAF